MVQRKQSTKKVQLKRAVQFYLKVSKQSVQQKLCRHHNKVERSYQFIEKAEAIRGEHPEMGCRKMALILKQPGMGRDNTEALLMGAGFRIIYPPNYTKTTHSVRYNQFSNLIEGLVINSINKVVQTDITYLWVKERFYYLIFIVDVYSRLITGYHASQGLEAESNMKALHRMVRLRGKENIKGLIHHSDKGSQYNCKKYIDALKSYKCKISMCKEAWQNAYTERINRTIKHEYLRHRNIDSLNTLRTELTKAVNLYNNKRPHWSLAGQMTPAAFENYINTLSKNGRPELLIYKPEESYSQNKCGL